MSRTRILCLITCLLAAVTVKGQQRLVPDSTGIRLTDTFRLGNVWVRSAKGYKADSLERQLIYHKYLQDADRKIKVRLGSGVIFDGFFTELAYRVSGQKKRLKRFAANLRADEAARFAATRYRAETVAWITGLGYDSAALFIRACPVDPAFARTASDLELWTWIRERCRSWTGQPPARPVSGRVPDTLSAPR